MRESVDERESCGQERVWMRYGAEDTIAKCDIQENRRNDKNDRKKS